LQGFVFALAVYLMSAGGKFMVGVQDASDTNSLVTPTSVVMQILVLLAASPPYHAK
jgi:hypothetical protein